MGFRQYTTVAATTTRVLLLSWSPGRLLSSGALHLHCTALPAFKSRNNEIIWPMAHNTEHRIESIRLVIASSSRCLILLVNVAEGRGGGAAAGDG